MTITNYSVQVKENGFPLLVPHTGKKTCEFLDKNKALEFLNKLKTKNPDSEFRILKKTTNYKPDKWI